MKRLLLSLSTLALLLPATAAAQLTSVPGFYARIFSDVEGYAYGSMRPLDTNAPNGGTPVFGATLMGGDDVDALGLSLGYGRSSGVNPWRIDAFYERIEPDAADGVNGVGVTGAIQIAADQGLWAITASGG
ncbi:MAG TPA: hypothetical protein VGF40_10505, partial [Thermoanaerobaculia bacterium]